MLAFTLDPSALPLPPSLHPGLLPRTMPVLLLCSPLAFQLRLLLQPLALDLNTQVHLQLLLFFEEQARWGT